MNEGYKKMGGRDRGERPGLAGKYALMAAIVFVFAIGIFLPILKNGFVNWDDPLYVYQNPHIRSLDIRWIFTAVVASNYHPLTLLSHTLDYALFGLSPWGHHLTSIVLHGLNSALFFLLAGALMCRAGKGGEDLGPGRGAGAFIAALAFAAHPLHVESVAWVSERKDVLSAFFFLLSILSYTRYGSSVKKAPLYGLTILFFILALLSKPMAITLPVVLLILDYYPLERPDKGLPALIIEKVPFFALSAASAILTLWAQRAGGGLRGLETHSPATRLYIAVRAVVFYIYKLILPVNLSPYYPLPFRTNLLSGAFLGSLAFIILVTLVTFFALRQKKRWPLALWAFYLVTLLPVSGLVTVGGQASADRYAYIPTMGFFMLFGVVSGGIFKKDKSNGAWIKVLILPAIIVIILGIITIRQGRIWHDSISLMTRAIDLYPERAAIPYNNRGLAYDAKGELQKALSDYDQALAISPSFVDAYINRGIIYGESSLYGRAIKDFNEALAIDPSSAKAFLNRGAAFMGLGDYARAITDLERATALSPKNAAALYNLGLSYMEVGQREKAMAVMGRAAGLGLNEAREFLAREGER